MMSNIVENNPSVWLSHYPWPGADTHKHMRGHAVLLGGEAGMTGAARLAARAALRVGAGLVTIACSPAAQPLYADGVDPLMTRTFTEISEFNTLLTPENIRAVLIGPGAGINARTLETVQHALAKAKHTVLDADALNVFQDRPHQLWKALVNAKPAIFTPHEGEFARLFGPAMPGTEGKVRAALQAAQISRAIIVLKGAETVIACPEGRAVVNRHSSPWLATAGTGDVLAGMILGLLAQGMDPFHAACAAVWLHGDAAHDFGPGLISSDLPDAIPASLRRLQAYVQPATDAPAQSA